VGPKTVLKNKIFCKDVFQFFFARDQNPNSLYLQVPKSYFSLEKMWIIFWIETDSTLVVLAANSSNQTPWELRNRWLNVMTNLNTMNYLVSHIFREGNQVADLLANHFLTIPSINVWQEVPMFIKDCYIKNKLG
jgi:hypothetical protein